MSLKTLLVLEEIFFNKYQIEFIAKSHSGAVFIAGDNKGVYSCMSRIENRTSLLGYLENDQIEEGKISIDFDYLDEKIAVISSDGKSIQIYCQKTLEKVLKITL